MTALQWTWVALATAVLGAGGIGLVADGLPRRDWHGVTMGSVVFAMALLGVAIANTR